MKVVGIVAQDWANAAWNVFEALKRGGVDARLINLRSRTCQIKNYTSNYDIKFWLKENKKIASKLIEEADIYHIFESGGTVGQLAKLDLAKKPRIMSINSSSYYRNKDAQFTFDKKLAGHADKYVALTLGCQVSNVALGLQPLDIDRYIIRNDYSLRGKKLVIGCAPGYSSSYNKKGLKFLKEKKLPNLQVLMNLSHENVIKHMNNFDIFTHGCRTVSYGYALKEAAALGIPCIGHVVEKEKEKVLFENEFPILEIGYSAEYLDDVLKILNSEQNRRYYGQLAAKWVRKYHSYDACCKTYKKHYNDLLGFRKSERGEQLMNFWSRRKDPSAPQAYTNAHIHIDYIKKHLQDCRYIMDFGVGIGRTFSAYENVEMVEGFDITDLREKELMKEAKKYSFNFNFTVEKTLGNYNFYKDQQFDAAVVAEVFLHIAPEDIDIVIQDLMRISKKIIVVTWMQKNLGYTEGHKCFHHNYKKICERNGFIMSDFEQLTDKAGGFIIRRK